MSDYSESLTVQILADSSQFSQELESVISRMNSFNRQLEQIGRSQQGLITLERRVRALGTPLTQVTGKAKQLVSQIRQLSGLSVSINVAPAMAALAQLSAAISRVASQLSSLGGGGGVPRGISGTGGGGTSGGGYQGGSGTTNYGNSGGIRGYAQGGLVQGPAGRDRVPAMLSAGEFVLQRSVVNQLGGSFLESLNQSGSSSRGGLGQESPFLENPNQPGSLSRESPGQESSIEQTVNQFGEISIHVAQSVDLEEIVSDLQFAGHRLRNRRG